MFQSNVRDAIRGAGLDDGEHDDECVRFQQDARDRPPMEAAFLSYTYLPREKAKLLTRSVAEQLGVLERDLYCEVCGTKNEGDFDLHRSIQACSACYDELGPPDQCSRCGISTYEGDVTITPIIKHYPPDPVSMIFWLKNRCPKRWRDKIDKDINGSIKVQIVSFADAMVADAMELEGGNQ